jgi:hypothetical protein
MVALALARPAAFAFGCVPLPAPIAPAQLPLSPGSLNREGYVEGSVIRAPPMGIAFGEGGSSGTENCFSISEDWSDR